MKFNTLLKRKNRQPDTHNLAGGRAFSEGDKLDFLYRHARVTDRHDTEAGVEVVAEAPESVRLRLRGNAEPAAV